MVLYCIVLYGMVWYGMVWYGIVWYGMVWYGMVWYGIFYPVLPWCPLQIVVLRHFAAHHVVRLLAHLDSESQAM